MQNINSEVLNNAIKATVTFIGADARLTNESEKVGLSYVAAGIKADWLMDKKAEREIVYTLTDGLSVQRKALFELVKETVAKKALTAAGFRLFTTDVKSLSDAEKAERVTLQREVSKRMGNLRRSIATYEAKATPEEKAQRTADEMFLDVIARASKLVARDDFTNGNKASIAKLINEAIKLL
jgi:hypothetical protein